MGPFGIGQAVKRFEDPRLVRGGGRFHADVNLPGQAHAVVVRSVHAHARILGIDASAALRAPGVLAVFTGDDLARAGLGTTRTTLVAHPARRLAHVRARRTRSSSATGCGAWAIPSPSWSPRRWPRPKTRPSWSGSSTSRCPR